ncbi:MAG: hypothetical protein JWL77_6581 [Chthonomonadaceae bacterium]|nr:hypothetical protein [Chthonomonadaceae bacterium]
MAAGLMLMIIGAVLLCVLRLGPLFSFVVIVVATSTGGGIFLHRTARSWKNNLQLRRSARGASAFAEEWIPMLYGNYTPYVVEAAERLGAARETTAVPALMHVLEQTVNTQPPDWCETAEALVIALGKMGDRRALPLLQRLSNVRGIGLLTVVHEAIDRIEPETSLLRPGSADDLPREILLRPAESCPETDPATLLRAHNGLPQ